MGRDRGRCGAWIGCIGAALAVGLVILRAQAAFGWADLRDPSGLARRLAVASYADLVYVAVLTMVAGVVCLAARRRRPLARGVVIVFLAAACCSLALGFVNVRALAELGRPINYQWLYYSHFMQSMDSYTALAALLSWRWIGQVALACAVLVGSSTVLARTVARRLTAVGRARLAAAVAVGMGA